METNHGLRWYYWMWWVFVGGLVCFVTALLHGPAFGSSGSSKWQEYFYAGVGIASVVGLVVAVIVLYQFDVYTIQDAKAKNSVMRVALPVLCGAAAVLYAVLMIGYKWYGICFLLHGNGVQTVPTILYLVYLVLCGAPGYYVFLLLVEQFGNTTEYVTQVTTTYDFAPSESVTHTKDDPHVSRGQFLLFGAIGIACSLACALTPLLFPVVAFCCTSVFDVRNKPVLAVVYAVTALSAIGCALPTFIG